MTGVTDIDHGRILEQEDCITGVGLMTSHAVAILHRYVLSE
jgi:hypothetical protein